MTISSVRVSVLAHALSLSALQACASGAAGPLPGVSDPLPNSPEARSTPIARSASAPEAPVWNHYAEVVSWPPQNPTPFRSQGHLPRQLVDVRVNPESRAAYAALVSDGALPDATLIAELSHEPPSASGYAMRKTGRMWEYWQLDASGRVLWQGQLSFCERCHSQAPSDHVFGLPRNP